VPKGHPHTLAFEEHSGLGAHSRGQVARVQPGSVLVQRCGRRKLSGGHRGCTAGGHHPNYNPFTRDVARAKALIDQAQIPSARKFTVYPDSGAVGQKLAQIMQANLSEIGIDIDCNTRTPPPRRPAKHAAIGCLR